MVYIEKQRAFVSKRYDRIKAIGAGQPLHSGLQKPVGLVGLCLVNCLPLFCHIHAEYVYDAGNH